MAEEYKGVRATKFIEKSLLDSGLKQETADVLSVVLSVLFVLILSILAYLIVEKLINRLIKLYIKKNSIKWDDYLIKRNVLQKASRTIPFIIIYLSAPLFGSGSELIQRLSLSVILILLMLVINSFLDVIDDVYRNYQISRTRPIKGVLQVIKIILYMLTALVIIANLTGQDPLVLIGGMGALAAVFSLIFKDAILGMVAGAQLSANDMLRIGDWIDVPKYGANGTVLDITLTTVKVQNFDKTFVNLPAYALISDSFKNYRGMQEFGGRRIMRSIFIDTSSIRFCDEEMLEKFKKIELLKDYISNKEKEIEEHNKKYDIDDQLLINGRHLTNIGTFRAYIQNYLNSHPKLHSETAKMVRQLPPGVHGLPLEIYAFSATTVWADYEGVQADIFDHILAVSGEFDLRIFQSPSGYDLRSAFKREEGKRGEESKEIEETKGSEENK